MNLLRWIVLAVLLVGCERNDWTKEPATLHWDRDLCARCKMAISDRKFAVEAVDEQGRVYKFDDIGCLVLWHKQEAPNVRLVKIWIKDAKSGEWIDGRQACYQKGFHTPMAYGYGALKEGNGSCLSFDEVVKAIERMKR
ncbi:MAG: hypothetical protein C6I00_05260 [Nitratiruptor sp.]|nr:hypothetical protein [Nitratiruptor sp.]NPA83507.1 hypothetical protein [Campylobacterota bacterium]